MERWFSPIVILTAQIRLLSVTCSGLRREHCLEELGEWTDAKSICFPSALREVLLSSAIAVSLKK